MANLRIISLLPSATEIVCALGAQDQLVGRSHECDHPEGVEKLPVCSRPKLNPDGTSYAIDEKVKALVQEGLSVYRIDAEKIKTLKPDLIITQSQCEVCAVSMNEVEKAVRQLTGDKPDIIDLQPNNFEDIFNDIGKVAQALGVEQKGQQLADRLQTDIDHITKKAQSVRPQPRVVCLEWLDPLMTAGNWMPTLIQKAGGVNCLSKAGEHSGYINWEEVVKTDPDLLLLTPCGFTIEQTLDNIEALTGRPEWASLKAVKKGHVYIADGHQYFNRPGPRILDSVKILAEIFHPNEFKTQYEDRAWIQYFSTLKEDQTI